MRHRGPARAVGQRLNPTGQARGVGCAAEDLRVKTRHEGLVARVGRSVLGGRDQRAHDIDFGGAMEHGVDKTRQSSRIGRALQERQIKVIDFNRAMFRRFPDGRGQRLPRNPGHE